MLWRPSVRNASRRFLVDGSRVLASARALSVAVSAPPPSLPQSPPPSYRGRRWLDYFSSAASKAEEEEDLFLLERMGSLALTLKTCVIPERHPLNQVALNVRSKLTQRLPKTESDLLVLLEDMTQHLAPHTPPAPPKKLSLFGRLRSRLSFRKKSLAATSEQAVATRPWGVGTAGGEGGFQRALTDYHSIQAEYGRTSKALQFVSFDAPVPAVPVPVERGYELKWQFESQTCMRLALLRSYLARLRRGVADGDVKAERLVGPRADKLLRLCDAVLLGSASERLLEHLLLFDDEMGGFSQGSLQDALYLLYEPEVQTVLSALLAVDELHADLRKKKGVVKFASTYLLDRLELNVKSRCVLAWCDPSYKGFNALPDTTRASLPELLSSRAQYFEQGLAVGHAFVQDIMADRRLHYFDRGEMRESVRNGAVFIACVSVLDALIRGL